MIYTIDEKHSVREGVLGIGSQRLAKIIQWEDGNVDVVKIQKSLSDSEENILEDTILRNLQRLKIFFRDKSKGKSYKIEKRITGISLNDYYSSVPFIDSSSSYEIMITLAEELNKLLDAGIVHADVYEGNFIINWNGNRAIITAIDFGQSLQFNMGETLSERTKEPWQWIYLVLQMFVHI